MEASALQQAGRLPLLAGVSPYLRLQSDDRLIGLIRRGHGGAFDVLMRRYQARLLAFCRHMLASNEDAEDVLQEVFTAAFTAIRADDRPIQARAWLYRIARNRCLNHLRRPVTAAGQESMDVFEREDGSSAADAVHSREEFRLIVADVRALPETQRTALLLREIESLSYEQIAEAMETTVASVKSLLVRARMSLAEASEARLLSCAEVRLELGQVAEGIAKSSPQVRRHVKSCSMCKEFRRELRTTGRAVAAVVPIGPLAVLKGFFGAKLGGGAAGGSAIAGGSAGGGTAGGLVSAGVGSVAAKAAAGLVAAAIVTVGATEVRRTEDRSPGKAVAASPSNPSATGAKGPLAEPPRAAEGSHHARPAAHRPDAARDDRGPRDPQVAAAAPAPSAAARDVEKEPPPPAEPATEPAPEEPAPSADPPAEEPPPGDAIGPSTQPPIEEPAPSDEQPVTGTDPPASDGGGQVGRHSGGVPRPLR